MTANKARAAAERAARASYGRLLALLAAPTGDIELAEDCLSDAFLRALQTWPESGVPENPEGWLLTVARNRQRDVFKSSTHRKAAPLDDAAGAAVSVVIDDIDPDAIPDERLALLFVCAHPAIAAGVRTPLMLQTVLGFNAQQIALAYAIPAPTMTQRLVRAKRRIREARIPIVVPDASRMPERLPAVIEAIYGAYAIDWQLVSDTSVRDSLAAEAHYLAVTLAELLGDEPEAFGLAALITLSMSRTAARGAHDEFVPLEEQDTTLWDSRLISEGERYLRRAHALGRTGRFQLEAAIQSVHCARAVSGVTDWAALRKLYAALVSVAPTLGARVAFAATIGRIEGPDEGLAALDETANRGRRRRPTSAQGRWEAWWGAHGGRGRWEMGEGGGNGGSESGEGARSSPSLVTTTAHCDVNASAEAAAMQRFQPAWATRAHLLAEAGHRDEAIRAYQKAISLTTERGVRKYLQDRCSSLDRDASATEETDEYEYVNDHP